MSLADGTRLGAYEITGQIGVGGMGEVYRATDTKLGREVAIKTLPAALASDADRLARFEREAKLLASLNHAHIASIYSLDEHDGTLYIAMELVEGETLEEKLKAGALPVEEALRLGLQITEALEAAHEKGVVHRDLKPANVIVTPDGVTKVLDFGLAKAFSGNPNEASPAHSPALSVAMTQQGLVLGTAGYMSPEQASGQATDQRADVWAFGVVLYEMLTGLPLFSGESVPHILADVLRADPDWSALPPRLNLRVRLLLQDCLTKAPRNRLHSISDARIEIQKALSDPEGTLMMDEAIGARVSEHQLSRRTAIAWGAAGSVLGIGLGAVGAIFGMREPQTDRPVVGKFQDQISEQLQLESLNPMLAVSPDGSRIAYVANQELYLRNLGSFQSTRVASQARGFTIRYPVFSPDSEWLIYVDANPVSDNISIERVSVTGDSLQTVLQPGSFSPKDLSWQRDDAILFVDFDSGAIMELGLTGGSMPRAIVEPREGESLGDPSLFQRSGKDWLLFSSTDSTGQNRWDTASIYAQPMQGGERIQVSETGGGGVLITPTGHLLHCEGSTVFARLFDPESGTVTGRPLPVIENVRRNSNANGLFGRLDYALSNTGTLVYVPATDQTVEPTILAFVDESGLIERISDIPPGEYLHPRISPDGSQIAYTSIAENGVGQIWIHDLDSTSEPRQLTSTGSNTNPAWLPSGRDIAYQSDRDPDGLRIFRQSANGSGAATPLTDAYRDAAALFPETWSPDEATMFVQYNPGAAPSILTIDMETGEQLDTQVGFGYSIHPTGNWAVWSIGTSGVFINESIVDGSQIAPQIPGLNVWPVWSRGGERIFFRASSFGAGVARIFAAEIRFEDGTPRSNTRVLQIEGFRNPGPERHYDVAPDGRLLMLFPESIGDIAHFPPSQLNIVVNWLEELTRLVPTN